MKHCQKCNINFNTNEKLCPFCKNKLTSDECTPVFPTNIRLKTSKFISKILIFIEVVIIIISGFIELYTTNHLNITYLIIGSSITNYIIIYFILKNCQNVLKLFEEYGIILVVITMIWFFFSKIYFITNYIVPILCLFELIFNVGTSIVLKKNYIIDSFRLIIVNTVLLFVPIILVLLGLTTSNLLSYICFIFALIVSVGLIVFFLDDLKEELSKIFNI